MLQKETKIVADKISPFHNVFQTTLSILGGFSEKKGKVVRKFCGNFRDGTRKVCWGQTHKQLITHFWC